MYDKCYAEQIRPTSSTAAHLSTYSSITTAERQ